MLTLCAACSGTPTTSTSGDEPVASARQSLTQCVVVQRGAGSVADTTLATNVSYPGWGGPQQTLTVGGDAEALLRFDLGSIPANATVVSASLGLSTTAEYSNALLFARRATASWSEATASFPSFNQQLVQEVMGSMTPSSPNTRFTMALKPSIVQGWVDGSLPNHGLALETMVTRSRLWQAKTIFASSEAGAAALRPSLQVCYTPFDYCASQPCQNGATCQGNTTGYTCACAPGFTGANCQTNIDDCAGAPCQNGGSCADGINGYTCACAPGFTGANCQTSIDDCAGGPCQNGGTCTDLVNGYSCSCPPGFSGSDCEINIDDCAGNPCQNGGTCTDGVNGYTCACPQGYTGQSCELDVDDCAGNACQNGAACVDGLNAYTCACAPGFTGAYCQTNIDDCGGSPCQHGGTCVDGVNGYACQCAPGYTGQNCEIDIDDCTPNPCQNGATCTDAVNGFTCQCPVGFMGVRCDVSTSGALASFDVAIGSAQDQTLTAPGIKIVIPAGTTVTMGGVPVNGNITLTAQISSDPSQLFVIPPSEEEAGATGQVMGGGEHPVFPTYTFGPSGASFNPPLKVAVTVPAGMSEPTVYLCDDDGTNCQRRGGIFHEDTSVSPPETKLYVEVDHFSTAVITNKNPVGISYSTGPVMQGTPNLYYIWYGDWSNNTTPTILTDLAQSISGSPYMRINTGYSDTTGIVSGNVAYGGSINVAASATYGNLAMSDAQIKQLVIDSIGTGAGKLPSDANGIYLVLTAPSVTATSGFCTKYCGWHNYTAVAGTNIKYSFVGNAATACPRDCLAQTTSPNGNAGADGMASVLLHEIVETLSDPELHAWRDAAGNENADKCGWNFGPTATLANNAQYNVTFGARKFLIQQNWDPIKGACAMSAPAFDGIPKPDGTPCDDGNACTQTDQFQNGICVGFNPKVCPTPDVCHVTGSCNPITGICSNPMKSNFSDCDDGNVCSTVSSCYNGACTPDSMAPTCTASTNVALGKIATQSSTLSHGCNPTADKAIDGNTDGYYYSCHTSHTNFDAQAWWQVDLGAVYAIDHIDIWNRTDFGQANLANFDIKVSIDGNWSTPTFSLYTPGTPPSWFIPTPVGELGRYVRIQLRGQNYLHLSEVQVFACPAGTACLDLATPTSCKQILTNSPGAPSGTYTIDPDGPVGNAPFQVYCDMTTKEGGWTLLQSHIASTSSTQANYVAPGSGTYLAPNLAQALALASPQVRIEDGTNDVTTIDSYPISRLRSLAILNDDTTKNAAHWVGTGTSHLSYSCATTGSPGYPGIYWACGNSTGLHVLSGNTTSYISHSFNGAISQAVNVWVR